MTWNEWTRTSFVVNARAYARQCSLRRKIPEKEVGNARAWYLRLTHYEITQWQQGFGMRICFCYSCVRSWFVIFTLDNYLRSTELKPNFESSSLPFATSVPLHDGTGTKFRKSLSNNAEQNQFFWACKNEGPQQTFFLTKTGHCYLRSSVNFNIPVRTPKWPPRS